VTALRHDVASCARSAGLTGQRLDDFVVAVDELLTNAVRHGGGSGRLSLWRRRDAVVCEVTDDGGGMPEPRGMPRPPAADQPGGRGLWLADALTDRLEIDSGPHGTTVTILTRVASGS
jgi:anti-sigma regulatory factor (Ser/Thr protein kinase)